ncbi:MAG: hypothetical protein IIC74_12060 [Bacteroidetes bacterium]|nr:hypothetical protein [Bacteroidota bacterium]
MIYRFFIGGNIGTVTKGNLYTVINGVWVPSISSLQLGHNGTTWVPDNTIRYTLTGADYGAIVSALSGTYLDATSSMDNFGNFDRRSGGDAYWSDDMVVEALNIVLNIIDSSAAEEQKYVVTFDVFTGSSGTEDFAMIKIGGEWVRQ